MFSLIKPLLFKTDPEFAHNLAIKSLKLEIIPESLFKVENESILETNLYREFLRDLIFSQARLVSINKVIIGKSMVYRAQLRFYPF